MTFAIKPLLDFFPLPSIPIYIQGRLVALIFGGIKIYLIN
jgi:hypothetical protein